MDASGLIEFAKQFGIPMALFISLFIWTIKRYEKREDAYQGVIKDTTEALNKYATSYESLCSDVKEIKEDVESLKENK